MANWVSGSFQKDRSCIFNEASVVSADVVLGLGRLDWGLMVGWCFREKLETGLVRPTFPGSGDTEHQHSVPAA